MRRLQLNRSYKHHVLVGLILGLWLALFLVFIAPFDASDLSFPIRVRILPFYGVITFFSYLILIPIQNWVYRLFNTWNILLEGSFIFIFTLSALVGSYTYYQSGIINGTYPLIDFILGIYYPIFLTMFSVIIVARWFLNKKSNVAETDQLIIRGDNKLDILKLEYAYLVSISSADNYVEVNYLQDGSLKKKLLRTTLKKAHLLLQNCYRSTGHIS